MSSSIYLLHASCTGITGLTLGTYAYIMNFKDIPGWDNDTFGLSAKGSFGGIDLYGELEFQDKAGIVGENEAMYAHAIATKAFGKQSVSLGLEHLDAGFQTPLATTHIFNGFADVTDAARISGAHNGLTNLYVSHTTPIFLGIKWINSLHALGDNQITTDYGWEYDSVLTKKFDDNFTVPAKDAHFESDGDVYVKNPANAGLPTTTRFLIELDYTF